MTSTKSGNVEIEKNRNGDSFCTIKVILGKDELTHKDELTLLVTPSELDHIVKAWEEMKKNNK